MSCSRGPPEMARGTPVRSSSEDGVRATTEIGAKPVSGVESVVSESLSLSADARLLQPLLYSASNKDDGLLNTTRTRRTYTRNRQCSSV